MAQDRQATRLRRQHQAAAAALAMLGGVLGAVLGAVLVASGVPNTAAPATVRAATVRAAAPRGAGTTRLVTSHPVPALVPASSLLRQECVAAAARLGFSVPCPTLVPTLSGHAMSCPVPVGAATSTPCVGREGTDQYTVFSLEFSGFDVPRGYAGVGGRPVGHLTLEAHRLADDPLRPCIGGQRLGTLRVGVLATTEFTCPNDSLQVQREARHGEGAYVGHVALEWDSQGIRDIASAHGHTTANLVLLQKFVRSTVLVPPPTSPG